jgi:membrane-associated phospholipid phosphatase
VLRCAVACALGLAVVGVLAFAVDAAHARDIAILRGFTGLYGGSVDTEIRILARFADPLPYAVMGMLCIGVALGRGRTPKAVAAAVVLVGAGLTTQALKHVLDQPRYLPWLPGDSMANGWPSGHATAAMTLALCAVMVAPPTWRAATGLVAWGATTGLTYATLALVWHYPSDVLAGLLVAGLWSSAALAVLARADPGDPRSARPPRLGLLIVVGTGGAVAAAAVVGLASARVALDAADRAGAAAAASVIAGLALALVVVTAIAAQESER